MRTSINLVAAIAASLGFASTSSAYLGSFSVNDGYKPMYGTVLGDVSYNNAGQNGINAGGGAWQSIAADTGLWSLQTPSAGGVFANAALRAAFAATYPAYNPTPAGTSPIYLLGGHFPGRSGDNANLAFRNATPAGTGAARYRYQIDTYDTGGPVPASVTSGPVTTQFYFMPNPAEPSPPPRPDGTPGQSPIKFTMSLLDSSSNIGFQWGYARDNTVMWRDNPSNPWNYTSVIANNINWDGVRFNMDLTGDTFGIDYYEVNTNTWSAMVPAGTPMGSVMANFTHIDWQLEDNVVLANGVNLGGKNYFDDFQFTVPEPTSFAAAGLGLTLLAGRRRRTA